MYCHIPICSAYVAGRWSGTLFTSRLYLQTSLSNFMLELHSQDSLSSFVLKLCSRLHTHAFMFEFISAYGETLYLNPSPHQLPPSFSLSSTHIQISSLHSLLPHKFFYTQPSNFLKHPPISHYLSSLNTLLFIDPPSDSSYTL